MTTRTTVRATRWAPAFEIGWGTLLAGILAAALLGAVIALWVQRGGDWNVGPAWERAAMLRLHQLTWRDAIDRVLLYSPWLATGYTLFPLVILAGLWLTLRLRRGDLALRLLVVQAGALALNRIPKFLFERDRPNLWERRGQYQWASYPSGHMIAAVAVLFTIAILLHRERGWRWPYAVAAFVVLLTAYARLYLGVHWPSDLIGGAAMGVVWLAASCAGFPPTAVDPPEGA